MSAEQGSFHGLTDVERAVMGRLLRMQHEQQKTAPKPASPKGEAQRRRRERERHKPRETICGD
jgi:hypothetical protein